MRSLLSLVPPIIAGGLFLSSVVTAAPAAPLVHRATWTPAQGGCWSDNTNGQRALLNYLGDFNDLTPTKCQSLCEAEGFYLAGVEYSRECYCGNTIVGNNRPTPGMCTMTCSGDSNQICGGSNAIDIYVKDNYQYTVGPASVLQSYNGYSVTQCWQDEISNRVLKHCPMTPIDYDEMTVQKCIDGCAAAGYSSAGVEFGGECYCDNVTFPPSQSVDMNECNMPCTGDASEFCGGGNRIIIYSKPAPPAPAAPGPGGPSGPAPPSEPSSPAPPAIITYNGVIEVHDANTNAFLGYVTKDTQNGISKYSGDLNNAERFTFSALQGTTVTQAEIAAVDGIDGYPYFGLIEGYANDNSYIGPGNWQYLFVGGTSHSAPGATPQTGPNSYFISAREWESSVWTINSATGDITPQWVNPDNSLPTTYLIGWYGYILFGSGDPAQTNAHFGHSDATVKLKFNANPI